MPPATGFDPNVPSPARMYNYLAGYGDNFAADRAAAAALEAANPHARASIADNRAFLVRAVRWAAGQRITRYLDLGCGYPPGVIARAAGAHAKVLYVDSDPVVASHALALLRAPGAAVLKADLRDVTAVTAAAREAGIGPGQPACVVLGAVLHFLDAPDAAKAVAAYKAMLAPGSAVVTTVWATCDDDLAGRISAIYPGVLYRHSADDVAEWLDGLEVVEPGITYAQLWRPEQPVSLEPRPVSTLAGVGVKP